MTQFIELTVLGIILGSIYAISATGLVVTYTTSGIFNFAHGAVGMIAAYAYWELVHHDVVPPLVAMALVLLIAAPLFGLAVEWLLFRRLLGETGERPVMVSLGLLVILIGIALTIFGENNGDQISPLLGGTFNIAGVGITSQDIIIVVAAVLVAVALRFLFYNFRLGMALRAVVDDRDLLAMTGASPVRMSQTGWILGTFLGALAGVLIAQQQQTALDTYVMALLVVNGFAAAVVGRLRSVPLTYLGALVLGLAVTYYNSYAIPHLPQWAALTTTALPMVFLFVALILLPATRLRAVGRMSTLKPPRVGSGWESLGVGGAFMVVVIIFSLTLSGSFLDGTSAVGTIAGQTMIYGIIGVSLVLLIGYAGQVSLAQFTFMGIGAYVMGHVAGAGSPVGLVGAVLVCAAVGALIAWPTTRLRGLYLTLATFAFADACYTALFSQSQILGTGLTEYRMVLPGLSFASDRAEFILISVVFVLSALLVLAIRRSLFGRRLVALNDSPAACATIGLNAAFTKIAVFALAAGMAGLAGALWGTTFEVVGQTDVDIFSGVMFVLFVTIWGVRTISGAFLGALTFALLNYEWRNGVGLFAGVGIVLIGWAPNGILGISAIHIPLPWVDRRRRAHDGVAVVVPPDGVGLEGGVRAAG